MKIGLQVPNFTYPGGPPIIGPALRNIAQAAEEAGFSSLWVMDHFFQIGGRDRSTGLGPAEDEMLEGYSTLSYLAAVTRTPKLGTLVTGVVYRHPGVLIKTVTTLDVLSGGRAYLGIGAAWNEREAKGLGIPFPPLQRAIRTSRGDFCRSQNTSGRETLIRSREDTITWQSRSAALSR